MSPNQLFLSLFISILDDYALSLALREVKRELLSSQFGPFQLSSSPFS